MPLQIYELVRPDGTVVIAVSAPNDSWATAANLRISGHGYQWRECLGNETDGIEIVVEE